jgi:hypothetical protein
MSENPSLVNNNHPSTIIDVAYELLSLYGPLTVEQMAIVAEDSGYQIAGWEFQAEIEQHLLIYGESSPFIEIGQDHYGLLEIPGGISHHFVRLERYIPAGFALALVVAFALSIMIGGMGQKRSVNSVFLPATLVETISQPNIALAAEPLLPEFPNPAWWFDHPTNQINAETQTVARQYLSNHYNTCGPAVVAMLASYYHSSNPGKQVTTTDVLNNARTKLGYYTPPYNSGLLTFKHLRALLELYGLTQTHPSGNGSLIRFDELVELLRQGQPAIVGARYRYQSDWRYVPAGSSGLYNHFVIIFGLEQIGGEDYLWVSNPHPGKYLYEDHEAAPVRISAAEFWQSWALKDNSDHADHGHAAFFGIKDS